jgi:hypothetical protein
MTRTDSTCLEHPLEVGSSLCSSVSTRAMPSIHSFHLSKWYLFPAEGVLHLSEIQWELFNQLPHTQIIPASLRIWHLRNVEHVGTARSNSMLFLRDSLHFLPDPSPVLRASNRLRYLYIYFSRPYPCVSALTIHHTWSVFFSLIVRGFRSYGEHLVSQLDLGWMLCCLQCVLTLSNKGSKFSVGHILFVRDNVMWPNPSIPCGLPPHKPVVI